MSAHNDSENQLLLVCMSTPKSLSLDVIGLTILPCMCVLCTCMFVYEGTFDAYSKQIVWSCTCVYVKHLGSCTVNACHRTGHNS